MSTYILDGESFKNLLANGAQFLFNDIDRINALNVFPVPDGDTGTNMYLTISGGVKDISLLNENHIGKLFKTLAKSMTMSARGNSGVILSQFFKGMSSYLVDKEDVNIHDLIYAFSSGAERSYKVVQKPTEGTMLTVMREAAEYVKKNESKYNTIDEVFIDYIKSAHTSLNKTPELLPVLKEAGVVDSGGAGFVLIFEGMLLALNGTLLELEKTNIQINDEVENDAVIEKEYAVVAVSPSEGISELLSSLECDVIVSGGQTMNPSSNDFINAFKKLKAEYIYVFPNNKNIFMSAVQASEIYKDAHVIIIPTRSVAQCYSALTMLDYSSSNYETIKDNFMTAINDVTYASVTYAIRDSKIDDIIIHQNEYLSIINDHIVDSSDDKVTAIKKIISKIENIDEKSVISLIYGKDINEEEINKVKDFIHEVASYLEIVEIYGGQEVYSVIIAIE